MCSAGAEYSGPGRPGPTSASLGRGRAEGSIPKPGLIGSSYIAKDTKIFVRQLRLKPCFTPVHRPQRNGMSEAFVKTLKRDHVQVAPLPDAEKSLD